MIALNHTGNSAGLGPGGLHGLDPFSYPVPTPVSLGDISPSDASLVTNLVDEARQAFVSTQPSAVAEATYGGGTSGVVPPGVNAGSISFGGSTGILILVGIGLVAFAMMGNKGRR